MAEGTSELDGLANLVLDVVPLVMRSIRCEMRRNRGAEISVPQFRILSFVRRRGTASLSKVAEHLGLTLPSTSKMVDALVGKEFINRNTDPDDRRRMVLTVTQRGQSAWEAARRTAHASMVQRLRKVRETERQELQRSLQVLGKVYATATDSLATEGA